MNSQLSDISKFTSHHLPSSVDDFRITSTSTALLPVPCWTSQLHLVVSNGEIHQSAHRDLHRKDHQIFSQHLETQRVQINRLNKRSWLKRCKFGRVTSTSTSPPVPTSPWWSPHGRAPKIASDPWPSTETAGRSTSSNWRPPRRDMLWCHPAKHLRNCGTSSQWWQGRRCTRYSVLWWFQFMEIAKNHLTCNLLRGLLRTIG